MIPYMDQPSYPLNSQVLMRLFPLATPQLHTTPTENSITNLHFLQNGM